jgi:hypothetical protein
MHIFVRSKDGKPATIKWGESPMYSGIGAA